MKTAGKEMFIAIDGDDVGTRIELFILEGQIAGLKDYSEKFNAAVDWLIGMFTLEFNARVYLKGGDSILFGIPSLTEIDVAIERLREQFAQKSGNTLSIGIGYSSLEAYLALKYAKASGKNCIRYYSDFQ